MSVGCLHSCTTAFRYGNFSSSVRGSSSSGLGIAFSSSSLKRALMPGVCRIQKLPTASAVFVVSMPAPTKLCPSCCITSSFISLLFKLDLSSSWKTVRCWTCLSASFSPATIRRIWPLTSCICSAGCIFREMSNLHGGIQKPLSSWGLTKW